MKRLTPAAVTATMIAVVGLLVTAYFAKLMRAEEANAAIEIRRASNVEDAPRIEVPAFSTPSLEFLPARIAEETALAPETGMRAVTISLPATSIDKKLMRPGRHVDVYLTPNAEDVDYPPLHGGMTLTLFDGVRLLNLAAATASSGRDATLTTTVTLELTPEQANILILASEKGTIALSYNPEGKGNGGIAASSRDRATLDEILGLAAPANPDAVPKADTEPKPFVSESYKGATHTTLQFPNPHSNSIQGR